MRLALSSKCLCRVDYSLGNKKNGCLLPIPILSVSARPTKHILLPSQQWWASSPVARYILLALVSIPWRPCPAFWATIYLQTMRKSQIFARMLAIANPLFKLAAHSSTHGQFRPPIPHPTPTVFSQWAVYPFLLQPIREEVDKWTVALLQESQHNRNKNLPVTLPERSRGEGH